jgi:hypothetical protein
MKHTEHAYINAGYKYERASTPNSGQAAAQVIRTMLDAEHHTDRTECRRLIEQGRAEARQLSTARH